MKRRTYHMMSIIGAGFGMILSFQNCTHPSVSISTLPVSLSAAGVPIACNPLSGYTSCDPTSSAGLSGSVYYLPNGVGVDDYISHGTKLNLILMMNTLNVPERSWTAGFPLASGVPITEDGKAPASDGSNILNEYFGIDLNGNFELPADMPEGDYQFALNSDDGSMLDIGGANVVNDDGTHSVQWACGSTLTLQHGSSLPIRVRYYQGPRVEIALQVMMRPAAQSSSSCDDSGGFVTVPAEALSHN